MYALLKRVSQGETIRIALRGVPIAKLVPIDDRQTSDLAALVREIRATRKGVRMGKIAMRELIDEGRL